MIDKRVWKHIHPGRSLLFSYLSPRRYDLAEGKTLAPSISQTRLFSIVQTFSVTLFWVSLSLSLLYRRVREMFRPRFMSVFRSC